MPGVLKQGYLELRGVDNMKTLRMRLKEWVLKRHKTTPTPAEVNSAVANMQKLDNESLREWQIEEQIRLDAER